VRTLTLWTAVFVTGGIPEVATLPVILFILLGILQTATSLLTYTGIQRMGASRSEPLRNTYPLWSAVIAIAFLGEEAGAVLLAGTLFVVTGIGLVSWQPESTGLAYRWWYPFYSLAAAFFAGIAFPVRRYALEISNEPLFFAALLAIVSLACLGPNFLLTVRTQRPVWHARMVLSFIFSGAFETVAALLALIAVSIGRVVVVSPIVAITPVWILVFTVVFLRRLERVNVRTVGGTCFVVGGTIAIILAG
jgi:drug/metabolite transporter (DMT)-like permease